MSKLKIDLVNGILEVDGDDALVKAVYEDFKSQQVKFHIKSDGNAPRLREETKAEKIVHQGGNTDSGKQKKKHATSPARGTFEYLNDLADRLDKGAQKLSAAVNEREVSSGAEYNTVFVYFLEKVLKEAPVNLDKIYTCYQFLGVKYPSALRQSLLDTSNRRRWINTSNMDDIKLTSKGENAVLHELLKKPESGQK